MGPEAAVSYFVSAATTPVLESPSQAVFARGPHWVFREQEDMELWDAKRRIFLLERYNCGRRRS